MRRLVRRAMRKTIPSRFNTSEGSSVRRGPNKVEILHKALVECMDERRLANTTRIHERKPMPAQVLRVPLLHVFSGGPQYHASSWTNCLDEAVLEGLINSLDKEGAFSHLNRFACHSNVIEAVELWMLKKHPILGEFTAALGENCLVSFATGVEEEQVAYIGWAMNTPWWNAVNTLTHVASHIMRPSYLDEVDHMKNYLEDLKLSNEDEANEFVRKAESEYWNDPKIVAFLSKKPRKNLDLKKLSRVPGIKVWHDDAQEFMEEVNKLLSNLPYQEFEALGVDDPQEPLLDQSILHRIYLGISDELLIETDVDHVNNMVNDFVFLEHFSVFIFSREGNRTIVAERSSKDTEERIHRLRGRFVDLIKQAQLMNNHVRPSC